MNKNVKYIILIVVLIIIIIVIYMVIIKNNKFLKGYAKKTGEWVACQVKDYDKHYYTGYNTAGVTIYFKKKEVKTRAGKDGLCADASKSMNVYTLK